MSDLISAAIDAIQKERHEAWEDLKDDTEYRKGYDDGLAESIRILIDDLPSAQPEPQWIPCDERLPEDDIEVFVYLFGRPTPYIAWVEDCRWYTEDFEVEKENYPTAWMPLPEPYEERR